MRADELGERVRAEIGLLRQKNLDVLEATVAAQREIYGQSRDARERMLAALGLGVHYLGSDDRLAFQYFAHAEALMPAGDALTEVVKFYKAKAQVASGAYSAADQELKRLATNRMSRGLAKQVEELRIRIASSLADFDAVVQLFNDYAARYPAHRRSSDIVKSAALANRDRQNRAAFVGLVEDLAGSYPTTPESRWALDVLKELACEDEPRETRYSFDMGLIRRINWNRSLDDGLAPWLLGLLDGPIRLTASSDAPRRLKPLEKLDAYVSLKAYDEALALAQSLLSGDGLTEDQRRVVMRMTGRVLTALGRLPEAGRAYSLYLSRFEKKWPHVSVRENLASVYQKLGQYRTAASEYEKLARLQGKSHLRWLHFWNLFRAKDWAGALKLIERQGYVESLDPVEGNGRNYWRAVILSQIGAKDDADKLLRSTLSRNADSYYAALTLTEHPQLAAAGEAVALESDAEEAITDDGDPMELSVGARILGASAGGAIDGGMMEFQPIQDLLKLGLRDMARHKLKEVAWNTYVRSEKLGLIGNLAWSMDDYNPSRNIAYSPLANLRKRPRDYWALSEHQRSFAADWKVFYPLAYDDIVTAVTEVVGVDKYLLLSLMRAESFYDTEARSPVGARGLMQIMPYTAFKLAHMMGDDDFDMTKMSDPLVNISYGSYYLRKLLDYYGGNTFVALAAYNAGPDAVNGWLDQCQGCSTTEFIETIPYRETRRYVKRIVKYLVQYRRIYEGEVSLGAIPEMPKSLPQDVVIF